MDSHHRHQATDSILEEKEDKESPFGAQKLCREIEKRLIQESFFLLMCTHVEKAN